MVEEREIGEDGREKVDGPGVGEEGREGSRKLPVGEDTGGRVEKLLVGEGGGEGSGEVRGDDENSFLISKSGSVTTISGDWI